LWNEAITASRAAGDAFVLPHELVLMGVGHLFRDPNAARAAFEEALSFAERDGNLPGAGLARSVLGWSTSLEGRPLDAIRLLDLARGDAVRGAAALNAVAAEALNALAHAGAGALDEAVASADRLAALEERTGVRRDVLELQARALVAAAAGDYAAAIAHGRAALPWAGGVAQFRAGALETCALVELAAGHDVATRGYVDELLGITLAEGFVLTVPAAGLLDARLRRRSGDWTAAEDAAHAALAAAVELPAWSTVVDALETLGGLAADSGGYDEASRLLGAAAALRDDTGYRLCLSERDADLATLRNELGGERFDAVYADGRALSITDAIAYARRGRGERKRPSIGWDSLTPTETQIVDLVGGGLTNADIGERLFVSPRTVQAHLTRIYTKLGVTSRAELAARAAVERA